jgi:hypothetical protein
MSEYKQPSVGMWGRGKESGKLARIEELERRYLELNMICQGLLEHCKELDKAQKLAEWSIEERFKNLVRDMRAEFKSVRRGAFEQDKEIYQNWAEFNDLRKQLEKQKLYKYNELPHMRSMKPPLYMLPSA